MIQRFQIQLAVRDGDDLKSVDEDGNSFPIDPYQAFIVDSKNGDRSTYEGPNIKDLLAVCALAIEHRVGTQKKSNAKA